MKLNDSARSGVPDMVISGHGKTMWVEDKYVSVQYGIAGRDNPNVLTSVTMQARNFISLDRMTQLVTLGKLQKHSYRAEYWLYVECGGKHYIAALKPRDVFESLRDRTEMTFNVMGIGEWIKTFDI